MGDRQPGGRGRRRHHRRRHAHRLGPADDRCRRRPGEAGGGRDVVAGRLRALGWARPAERRAPSGRSWTPAWWASRRSCATAGGPNSPPVTPTRSDRGMAAAARAGLPVAVHCEEPSLFEGGGSERPVASEVAAVARAGAAAVAHGARLHVVHCSSPDAVLEAKRWAPYDCRDVPPLPGAQPGRREPDRPRRGLLPSHPRGGRSPAHGGAGRRRHDRQRGVGPFPCPPALKEGSNPFAGVARASRRRSRSCSHWAGVAARHRAAPRRGRGAVRTGAQGRGCAGVRRRSGPRRRAMRHGRWRPRPSTAAIGARRSSAASSRVSWSPPSWPAWSSTRRAARRRSRPGGSSRPGVPGATDERWRGRDDRGVPSR